jgi:hypothetical protein
VSQVQLTLAVALVVVVAFIPVPSMGARSCCRARATGGDGLMLDWF